MSSYITKARDRKTGTEFAVTCYDDYFGRHRYGYEIHERDEAVLTEEQFQKSYEEINESQGNA